MGGSIQVPSNIEDKTVLKRFLTDLVMGINGSTLFSGNVQEQNAALLGILKANPNLDFLNLVAKLNELRTDILTYVEDNLETVILQQQEDIAVIAEQFGTFYNQALAASWYGLSVKAGGAVAGLEIGSLDPNVTTPGDENSYFRVVADNFIVGRAYEDLTQEEKNYLSANGLPAFGTVYNAQKQPVPALITSWDSAAGTYKHFFNGIVQFTNVSNGTGTLDEVLGAYAQNFATIDEVLAVYAQNIATLEETNDGVVNSFYLTYTPTSGMNYGDWWIDIDSNPLKAYRYEDINGKNIGTLAWRDNSNNIVGKAYIAAVGAQATADGKITTFYSASQPTAISLGDMWVNSSSHIISRWNGSAWIIIDTAAAINNGTTTINGGKITTNTVEANVLKPSTGGATVWSGGALISQNFNGNSVGNIGAPTQGFRLSSNAEGTSSDPNIYGAYIKGGTIEGVNLSGISLAVNDIKVRAEGYSNNFGPLRITSKAHDSGGIQTSVNTAVFRSRGYSSGYLIARMCPLVLTFKISALWIGTSVSGTGTINVYANVGGVATRIATNSTFGITSIYTTYTVATSSDVYFTVQRQETTNNTLYISIEVEAENYG